LHRRKNKLLKIKIFFSKGCPYCPDAVEFTRKISNLLDVRLEEIDVTNDASILVKEKIIGVPTAILYADGREIKRYIGLGTIKNELITDILDAEGQV